MSAESSVSPRIFDARPARLTQDHNYRQFMFAVLLSLGVLVGLFWLYEQGEITKVINQMGPYFSLGFVLLLGYGLGLGLYHSWWVSRSLNGLKQHHLEAPELRKFFGVDSFTDTHVELLKGEIADTLLLRLDQVRIVGVRSAQLGLAGTLYGLILALEVFSKINITKIEDVAKNLPEFSGAFSIAFVTTLVGLVVSVVVDTQYRLLRRAANDLKMRIFRTLHGKNAAQVLERRS